MAIDKALYTATATATGGRAGTAESSDGALKVTLSTPKQLGGDGAFGTNPEQLFAAGYSACFIGAMKAVEELGLVRWHSDEDARLEVAAVSDVGRPDILPADDLGLREADSSGRAQAPAPPTAPAGLAPPGRSLREMVQATERQLVQQALRAQLGRP